LQAKADRERARFEKKELKRKHKGVRRW